ncbi:hypothetical protein U1Q18_036815 [Sarracenia purpurea var. burkii]
MPEFESITRWSLCLTRGALTSTLGKSVNRTSRGELALEVSHANFTSRIGSSKSTAQGADEDLKTTCKMSFSDPPLTFPALAAARASSIDKACFYFSHGQSSSCSKASVFSSSSPHENSGAVTTRLGRN